MNAQIGLILEKLFSEQHVSQDDAMHAIGSVMEGEASEIELASLLTAFRFRGETAEILAGAAAAMRARCERIESTRTGLLDTCGTGGDGLQTFNISTATAIVVASCGVPVAKHGNRAASSRTGSADVLEQLGVSIQLNPAQVASCIDEIGIGFCFAPLFHGAMKHAAAVRKQLGFRTLFNLLGPLTNPACAGYQLIGTSRVAHARLMSAALFRLGTDRSLVVCGNDELDEVCLWGATLVFEVTPTGIREQEWRATNFGLPECQVKDIQVSSSAESAERIRSILAGEPGPSRDIVIANSAAALLAAGRATHPQEAAQLAGNAIARGESQKLLNQLIEYTSGQAGPDR